MIGRQSLAESEEFIADAASVLLGGLPGATFLPALRRANVRGALDMGLTPGLLPGRTTIDAGRAGYERRWPGLPAQRGLDTAGILAAAAEGAIEVLVLLGADPLADFPDPDLARAALAAVPTIVAVDLFVTDSVERGRRRAGRRRLRREGRHHDERRGPGQPAAPEGDGRRAPPGPTG